MIEKRKDSKGNISYRVKIRLKGHPSVSATFTRLTDAKIWESKTETEIRENRYFKQVEAKKHTMSELIDRYIEIELPQRKSDRDKFKMQLLWWESRLGAYLLVDITPAILSQCKDDLRKEPSPKPKHGKTTRSNATVNRYLACLSIVLSKAVKEWQWMEENPMLKVSKMTEPKGRIRFLSNEEVAALLEACKQSSYELYLLVLIALSTGARYGEIIKLTWDTIDLKNKIFHFLDTKNGDDRGVSVPNIVYNELVTFSKIRQLNSSLLFARKDGEKPLFMKKGFRNAVKNVG